MKIRAKETSIVNNITEGKIYEAEDSDSNYYKIKEDDKGIKDTTIYKARFDVVAEYTIEQLRSNKIVVRVENIEQFTKILSFWVPERFEIHKEYNPREYPFFIHLFNEDTLHGSYNSINCYTDYEEISYEQVIFPEEEFKFPEKWYIKRDKENCKEVNKWFGENVDGEYDAFSGKLYFPSKHYSQAANSDGKEEYTEITFEQFKKYVLKQAAMQTKTLPEKGEVEYYEVIKQVPFKYHVGDKLTCGERYDFEHAHEFPEYFHPVYKEEFRVGDYITILKTECNVHGNVQNGYTYCISKVENRRHISHREYWLKNGDASISYRIDDAYRKATPEEIAQYKKSQEIQIGTYKFEVKNNKAAFGCKEFTKEELLSYKRLVGDTEILASIEIHGVKITEKILDTILHQLK